MIQTARATSLRPSLCLVCTRCRRARGEGWRDGKEREFFFVSPQQLDGISNIRSWNARNAGQSDPTKEEEQEEEKKEEKEECD